MSKLERIKEKEITLKDVGRTVYSYRETLKIVEYKAKPALCDEENDIDVDINSYEIYWEPIVLISEAEYNQLKASRSDVINEIRKYVKNYDNASTVTNSLAYFTGGNLLAKLDNMDKNG
jgi:hypothetical protein